MLSNRKNKQQRKFKTTNVMLKKTLNNQRFHLCQMNLTAAAAVLRNLFSLFASCHRAGISVFLFISWTLALVMANIPKASSSNSAIPKTLAFVPQTFTGNETCCGVRTSVVRLQLVVYEAEITTSVSVHIWSLVLDVNVVQRLLLWLLFSLVQSNKSSEQLWTSVLASADSFGLKLEMKLHV